jgi:hypothetical protein
VSDWFDARAARSRGPSPARRHKANEIKAELAKSDGELHGLFSVLNGFDQSAIKFGPDPKYAGGVSPTWTQTLGKLSRELLVARDRLGALHTGLRAELELRQSLTEAAAALTSWEHALSSQDAQVSARAETAMKHHFTAAERYGKAGLADLKRAR